MLRLEAAPLVQSTSELLIPPAVNEVDEAVHLVRVEKKRNGVEK